MAFWDKFKELLIGALPGGTILSQKPVQDAVVKGAKIAAPVVGPIVDVVKPVGKFLASGITEPLKGVGLQFGAGPGGLVAGAGAQIGTSRVGAQLERDLGLELNSTLRDGLSEYAQETAQEAVIPFDPLLQAAVKAEEYVFSPVVKRPIGTAALLTDPSSPLYENGPYGQGLQLEDIQTAYNRTEDVSLGVALTKSYLNPFHVTGISDAILEDGGVDIDRVNLWNDEDVQKNFVDNTTGRWMTGFTDALIGNVAVFGATAGAVSALRASARAAGLSNKLNVYDVNAISKLETLADDHLSGRTQTTFGSDIQKIAESDNIIEIKNVLKPHTNNPRLATLALETKDPAFVRDLILADKGYGPAIGRIMNANKTDDLWYASSAADEVAADFAATGKYRSYNTEIKERWSKAFDDAIAKNPEAESLFNAFMSDRYDPLTGKFLPEPRVMGTTYMPMEPIAGRGAFIKARDIKQKFQTGSEIRDYSNVGGVVSTLIGSGRRGGAATALIHFTGSKLPRGIVSHSGLRPGDAIEEINAWLDDIPLFRRGGNQITLSDGTTVTAAEYRRNLIDDLLRQDTDVKRSEFFKRMNEETSLDILVTMGLNRIQAKGFIDEVQESLRTYHGDLTRDSYAMDPSGVKVVVSPQTQRQLADATPLIPMGKIVREASRVNGAFDPRNNLFTDLGRGIFESGNKLFSFSQLVRPAYIPKNSIFEPLNSAVMSQGSKFLYDSTKTFAKNTIFNNKQRFNALVNKANIKDVARRKAVKEEYGMYSDQYEKAIDIVDNSTAEWVEFFVNPGARSPATRAEYADTVKADLRAAERLVANLEQKMRKRAREFGLEREEIPTLYGLTRRVQYLKSLKDPKIGSDIRSAELVIAKAAQDINTLAPDLNKLDADIKKAYDDIDKILVEMGPARKALADEWSVVDNARIRRRGRQEEDKYVVSNGQTISIPRLESENHFGTSYKAEVSNRQTRELEILGDKTFSSRTQILGRRSPGRITDVNDPLYFDELAYVVNNYMRGDVLVDQILAGRTRDEIIQTWGLQRAGRSYANDFGRDRSDIIDIIDDQISYVNRYLPTLEAKAYALSGEVRGNRLAQILGDKLDELRPINPLENKYATPIEQAKNFLDAIDRATAKAWAGIASPENAIRWAWASTEFNRRTVEKLELLASQGYDIGTTTINSVRQAAAIEMVKEAEKTFYSIRRQNRALYAARTLFSFPAAAASGMYRYTRFAAKSPQRMAGFLNSYYGLYNSFGVDKYGNPVEDPLDAEFLIVPGTKELGLNEGRGIMVGTRAVNFLANLPGPSYAVPISVGQILAMKPGNDKVLKDFIDNTFGKIPGQSYQEMFPFGIETDLSKQAVQTFTPAWARNAITWLTGDESKQEWMDSYASEWNYQMTLYEMGLGKAPNEKSVAKQASKKFREKAFWQFASPLGTPAVVDMRPDNIFSTYFRLATEKYKMQGMSDREAKALAEQDMNARIAPITGGVEFPMERLNYGAKIKSKATYIVPTVEGYKRVWEEFDYLANKLGKENKNLIGLITSDLQGAETDPNISRILNKPGTTLPDGTVLNLPNKSIADVERNIEVSRVWKAYSAYKDTLNQAAKKADYQSYASVPELREALQKYAKKLGEYSPSWGFEYSRNKREDYAYQYAWGLNQIVFDKKFMEKHGNSQYWNSVRAFLKYRNDYVNLLKDVPTGYKGRVISAWQEYVNGLIDVVDPKLANLIDRYFESDTLREVKLD
jgi:hypothetical protein